MIVKIIIKCTSYIKKILNHFNKKDDLERLLFTENEILNNHDKVIIFFNKDWYGISSSTKNLFNNAIDLGEINTRKGLKIIFQSIKKININQIVFSGFAKGYRSLIIKIKKFNPKIIINVLYHGNHSQIIENKYSWEREVEIIKLYNKRYINRIGTCKESLNAFFRSCNINSFFIGNKVDFKKNKLMKEQKVLGNPKIGIYAASGMLWRKNISTQLFAVSLVKNASIDIVKLDEPTHLLINNYVKLNYTSCNHNLTNNELIDRMSKNDLNLYITYSECSSMIPLESISCGVPCIIGNNSHYFKDKYLNYYLVVNEEDNIYQIKSKIVNLFKNIEEIKSLCTKWLLKNNRSVDLQLKKFMEIKDEKQY